MKIFRTIRMKMIGNRKISNYLLYALGEILLVMIGILLALQVNNWNQKRMLKNQLEGILQTVANDLKTDTTIATSVIDYYKDNSEKSLKLLNKEMDRDEFEACASCRSLITVYRPFVIQHKGFDQLKNFAEQRTAQTDSLITNITQFYTVFKKNIDDSNQFVKEEILNNLQSYRTKPWFVQWTQGALTDEMINYFMADQDHLNRVAAHNVLAAQNHMRFASVYKANAEEVIKRIEKRLNEVK